MHVGQDAGKNEQRSGDGEQPPDRAVALPKENSDSKQHRQERDSETISTPKAPVRAHDRHLIRQEVSADATHREPDDKFTKPALGTAYVLERSLVCAHAPEDTRNLPHGLRKCGLTSHWCTDRVNKSSSFSFRQRCRAVVKFVTAIAQRRRREMS